LKCQEDGKIETGENFKMGLNPGENKSMSGQEQCQWIKAGIEGTRDLRITKNIKTMTTERKHRSRSTLHPKHFSSRFFLLWSVMAPHQPHLKTDAHDGSITRSPQPQQVVS
jgi:hypothetical protein